jgi:hypothetical protein
MAIAGSGMEAFPMRKIISFTGQGQPHSAGLPSFHFCEPCQWLAAA